MSIKITDWVAGEEVTALTVEWECVSLAGDVSTGYIVPTSSSFCLHLHDSADDELLFYVGEWNRYVTYSSGMVVFNDVDNNCYKAVSDTIAGEYPHESSTWELVDLNINAVHTSASNTVSVQNPVYIPANTVYTVVLEDGWTTSEGSRTVELSNAEYGDKIVTVTECYIDDSQIYNTFDEAASTEWQLINNTSEGYVVGVVKGYKITYDTLASGGEEPPITGSVDKWDWYSTNVNATAGETEDAYNALLSLGAVELFNFTVWNDLVDKVNEIIEALGGAWSTASTVDGSTYLTLEETKMSEDDSELTYHRFNSWRFNIGSRFSTEEVIDKPIKEEGDVVSAGDFLALAEHINNWIDAQL